MSTFFPPAEPQALGTIAAAVGAELADETQASRIVSDVMPLDAAGPDHVSFLRDAKLLPELAKTTAGAVFIQKRHAGKCPPGCAALVTDFPGNAFGLAASLFYPAAMRPRPLTARSGGEIAPTAIIEEPGLLEANVIVEAGAVIARGVEVGRGTVIGPNVVIGPGCTIGRNTSIGANCTIQCTHIGDNVIVHPNVAIGQDGFGLARTPVGYLKIPQTKAVVIQDEVELGSGTTVDRGSWRDTVIGKGSKVDNQCQIGHNVMMGVSCVLAGMVGVSGSVTMGDFVTIGGHTGLRDGLNIGSNVTIAGKAAVGEDIPAGETWGGYPAMEGRAYLSERRAIARLVRNKGNASNS